jgi:hypothetical protein
VTAFTLEVAADPPPAGASLDEGSPWIDGDGNVCARVYRQGYTRWIDWPALGLFAFISTQSNVRVWPADGVGPDVVRDFFERRLQPLLLQARGYQTLHASAVRIGSEVVALTGRSGSGKSTLAFALGQAGHRQIADDALVIDTTAQPPTIVPLPFLPQLKDATRVLAAGRTQVGEVENTAGSESIPLGAVVILQQDASAPREPRPVRVAGPAACVAVLAHAHVFDPADDPEGLVTAYARLVDATPVFELSYRPAIDELACLISAIRSLAS